MVKQAPYESLAEIYDFVMRHVDYDNWAAYIHATLQRFGCRPRNLVDLACGTGNITMELHNLDYQVTGVDRSASMIRVAGEKAARLDRDIAFVQQDLRYLAELGPFDAAVCLYDSFNYLLTPADMRQALEAIHRILRPGSLFVFDVCTEQNSLRYFRDVRDTDKGPGFAYERHSYYDKDRKLQYNHFQICFDTRKMRLEETHTQRIYPMKEIVARIEASSFELLAAFDDFTFKKGTPRSDRIHFVLQRPADGRAGETLDRDAPI